MVSNMKNEPIFYFDFGSPNAYMAYRVLPGLEKRTGVTFRPVPVLLGGLFKMTGNQSPFMAYANVPHKMAYERLEMERFLKRHGLSAFRMNPHFPVNTLALMRGAVAAEAEGILAPYMEAMFHYMWEEPRKLDDPAVLATTLAEAGLPAETLMSRAQEPAIKDALMANTQAAYDHGAFGIPSFVVNGDLYFGKDRLDLIEKVLTTPAP